MIVSEARIKANKANAARSSGPSSQAGKDRSRMNALKHSLCAEVVGLEKPEAVRERAGAIVGATGSSPPSGFHFGVYLFDQVGTLGLRIEHAQAMQEAARERSALRASLVWDDDRRLEATLLGGQLGGRARPDEVVEKLRRTPQGCDWLIARWALLAHAADVGRSWTPEQASLAFDLLGTAPEFREGCQPGADLDGSVVEPAELARRQIADLKGRRELVRPLDGADRRDAEAGLADDAEIRRLRRYEAALERRFRWTYELLRVALNPPEPAEAPEPQPGPEPPAPPSEKRADPSSIAIVKPPQSPTRQPSRSERRAGQAESRREARLRRLEERRA